MRRVLVVEDEEDLGEVLVELLREMDVLATHVPNGKEALEALDQGGDFDALLTDLNMPVMSGLDLMGHVRGRGHEIPIVVLTGYGDKEKAVEALRLGALDFIDKPFDVKTLLDVMTRVLEISFRKKRVSERQQSSLNNAEQKEHEVDQKVINKLTVQNNKERKRGDMSSI